MIVIFTPKDFPAAWLQRYSRCWREQATIAKDAVICRPDSDQERDLQWDRVNITPGRAVIWVRPEFIPHPSFFDELDYYWREGCLVVTQKNYTATFQPKADVPERWEPVGVSNALVLFQLTGQTKFVLPPASSLRSGPAGFLKSYQGYAVIRVEQYFAGDRNTPLMRSVLGVTFPSLVSGRFGTTGKIVTGAPRIYSVPQLKQRWLERIEGWEAWLRKPTTSFTQYFANAGPDD